MQTTERAIDPAQEWDFYKKTTELNLIHNCPIWNRLSGWAASADAACIIMGTEDDERSTQATDLALMSTTQYAKIMNKDRNTLYALVAFYKPEKADAHNKLYHPSVLDNLCNEHWPDENLITNTEALVIVKKRKYLPPPKWKLGSAIYFDKEECIASREAALVMFAEKRKQSRVARAKKSVQEKQKREIKDRIRKPRKPRVYMSRRKPIPEGYLSLSSAARQYNIPASTLSNANNRGIFHSTTQGRNTLFLLSEMEEFAKNRIEKKPNAVKINKPRRQREHLKLVVPDGYISAGEAYDMMGTKENAFYKAIASKRFIAKKYGAHWVVDKVSFLCYIEHLKVVRGERQNRATIE